MTRAWHALARPEQIPPKGNWRIYLVERGRGWGKTRAATEWLAEQAATKPGTRWALIGCSWRDIRTWLFRDILQALDLGEAESSNSISGIIRLTNGSVIEGFSADGLDRLAGPYDGALAHEINSWSNDYPWSVVEDAVAPHGRIFATATPQENLAQELAGRLTTRVPPRQVWWI
jgi:phage terminase large subunit-like protein